METPVEICYVGVVIGRAQEPRGNEQDPSFFLPVREPMPVGSVIRLRAGGRETPVRVVHAVESPDPTLCGMQVRPIGEGEELASEWIPPPPAPAEKARPVEEPAKTAMPIIEVAVSRSGPHPAPAVSEVAVTEPSPSPAASPPVEVRGESTLRIGVPPEAVPVAIDGGDGSSGDGNGSLGSAAGDRSGTEASETQGSQNDSQNDSQANTTDQPTTEDLPPARPISASSSRRKTKRRR